MIVGLNLVFLSPVQWDSTISYGNVLTIVILTMGFVAAWTKLGARVNIIEKWIVQHELEVIAREQITMNLNENFHGLDKSIGLLKQALDGACDRLERIENHEREEWDEHRRRLKQEKQQQG